MELPFRNNAIIELVVVLTVKFMYMLPATRTGSVMRVPEKETGAFGPPSKIK